MHLPNNMFDFDLSITPKVLNQATWPSLQEPIDKCVTPIQISNIIVIISA